MLILSASSVLLPQLREDFNPSHLESFLLAANAEPQRSCVREWLLSVAAALLDPDDDIPSATSSPLAVRAASIGSSSDSLDSFAPSPRLDFRGLTGPAEVFSLASCRLQPETKNSSWMIDCKCTPLPPAADSSLLLDAADLCCHPRGDILSGRRHSSKVWPSALGSWVSQGTVEPTCRVLAVWRFEHFVERVCRLSVWREDNNALFRQLQASAHWHTIRRPLLALSFGFLRRPHVKRMWAQTCLILLCDLTLPPGPHERL